MALGLSGLRTYPELRVLKGFHPDSASHRSREAPCLDATLIKSGMAISLHLDDGVYKWKPGSIAGQQTYIALYDGADPRYTASGLLTGLSLAPGFTLQTPYFGGTQSTFVPGVEIAAYLHDDGTAANRGKFLVATSGMTVCGEARSYEDLGAGSTDQSWATAQDSSASSALMITFDSLYTGLLKA